MSLILYTPNTPFVPSARWRIYRERERERHTQRWRERDRWRERESKREREREREREIGKTVGGVLKMRPPNTGLAAVLLV